jgi:hypothetical protein
VVSYSYPLTLPTTPAFRVSSGRPRSVVGIAESPFTLDEHAYEWPGQGMAFELELPPMRRAAAEGWIAFFLKLNGRAGTFYLGDPDGKVPRGSLDTSTPVADSSSSPVPNLARERVLVTRGWSSGATLKAGDYIQIGTGSTRRLHKNLSDVVAPASGLLTLDIWPWLRANVADATALTFTEAKGVFRLDAGIPPWTADQLSHFGIRFAAVEAINL